MNTEEAIQWCVEHGATVSWSSSQSGVVAVRVAGDRVLPVGFARFYEQLQAYGKTFVKAVERMIYLAESIPGRQTVSTENLKNIPSYDEAMEWCCDRQAVVRFGCTDSGMQQMQVESHVDLTITSIEGSFLKAVGTCQWKERNR